MTYARRRAALPGKRALNLGQRQMFAVGNLHIAGNGVPIVSHLRDARTARIVPDGRAFAVSLDLNRREGVSHIYLLNPVDL